MNQISINQYRLFLRIIENLCPHDPYFIKGEMQLCVLGSHSFKNIFMMLGCLNIMWVQMSPKILQVESKFIKNPRNNSSGGHHNHTFIYIFQETQERFIIRQIKDQPKYHGFCGMIAYINYTHYVEKLPYAMARPISRQGKKQGNYCM